VWSKPARVGTGAETTGGIRDLDRDPSKGGSPDSWHSSIEFSRVTALRSVDATVAMKGSAVSKSTVQWLLHRRMAANQQMRWSPRGAHMMLKVRTAVANGTLERDYAVAERWARRPFRRAA